jgi:hypothetical protein
MIFHNHICLLEAGKCFRLSRLVLSLWGWAGLTMAGGHFASRVVNGVMVGQHPRGWDLLVLLR